MSIRKFRVPAALALSLALMATPLAIATADEPVVDTTPAVVQSISPSSGALVSGTKTFVIKTDEWVSAYIEYNKNGVWKTDNTKTGENRYGSSLNFTVDTTKYGDGVFGLKINLKNKASLSTNTTATYTVDNTKPALSWVTPNEDSFLRGTVPVTVSATDANPLAYNLRVDSAGLKYTNPYLSGEQYFDWNTTTVADGRHKLYAAATDRATNKSEAFRFVTVDNTMPALTLPQGLILGKASQTIHVTQDEANPATTYVEINKMVGNKWVKPLGKEFKNVNEFDLLVDPVALGLQDGVKTQIKVTTTDKAGNKTSATSNVTVDFTSPSLVIEVAADNSTASVTASDPSGLFGGIINLYKANGERVQNNLWRPNLNGDTSAAATFGLPILEDGEYELRGGIEDKVGNKITVRHFFTVTNPVVVPETPVVDPEPQPEETPEQEQNDTPSAEVVNNPFSPESEDSSKEGVRTVPAAHTAAKSIPAFASAPARTTQLAETGSGWVFPALGIALVLIVGGFTLRALSKRQKG